MKIHINDKMAEEAIQLLKDEGYKVTYEEMDKEKLTDKISEFDGIMVRSGTKLRKEQIEAGSKGNLKVIGRAGIGVDNIDIKEAAKKEIKVVNAPTGATYSVAELTLGHMISLSRHICRADHSIKEGKWIKKQLKGNELHGKTLGLIGCGNIGTETAKYAQILDMKVLGYDPYISREELGKNNIEKIDDIGELMSKSDYVSLHLPHTKDTHHIVDKKMISKMKKKAFLINCSRGGTVDEKALYDALKNEEIAGAAIDVFENEPPEDNPLLNLDNVVLTPHLGANTKEGQIRAGTVCAEQMSKVLKGEEPDFWVNKKFKK